jgi:hypothetical protein
MNADQKGDKRRCIAAGMPATERYRCGASCAPSARKENLEQMTHDVHDRRGISAFISF